MILFHFVVLILSSDHSRVNPTQVPFCAFKSDRHLLEGQATHTIISAISPQKHDVYYCIITHPFVSGK
jgi:hypothetical protein